MPATYLGTRPETISRVLRKFQNDNFIKIQGRSMNKKFNQVHTKSKSQFLCF
ncbi:helix-turn-helix domain-containing protein [Candidatus Kryptobacter tengchongensis]|uniref:helix-turn-helix domain-containing protein n=1 Tax=Kryptobacter tengchongensis TaxID=1643429 RepID=UPI0009BE1A0C